jgi:hypothetical protein
MDRMQDMRTQLCSSRLPGAAVLQHAMVKELFAMARVRQSDRKLPGFRAQQWYFFYVAAFYIYLRWVLAAT